MRNFLKLFTLSAVLMAFISNMFAASNVSFTIKYTTVGTVSGYDHLTKMRVYCDGNELGENTPKKQTLENSITVNVPTGKHTIKAVLYAKPDNYWEERTTKNNYSFDCIYEKEWNLTSDKTIQITFNFNTYKIEEKNNTNDGNASSPKIEKTTTSSSTNVSSSTALKKLNDYLKTFDNGYYGYMEIKDGYLYNRFKSGKYTKTLLSDLTEATVEIPNQKVKINCKNGKDCAFSTYTDSYHAQLSFSQSTNFNTAELITLLNDVLKSNSSNSSTDWDKYKSNIDVTKSSNTKTNTTNGYQSALEKLNTFLKTFDNGYYGYLEVKDGFIYMRFKAGKYNKFKMEDMEGAIIQEQYNRVILKCKSGTCISTDWKENGKEEYSQFTNGSTYNYQELADLLNNFKDAYLNSKTAPKNTNTSSNTKSAAELKREEMKRENKEGTKTSTETKSSNTTFEEDDEFWDWFMDGDWDDTSSKSTTTNNSLTTDDSYKSSPSKYSTALKNLNDYLKIFNPETYKGVEVKDGKVYFKFNVLGKIYNSYIGINSLKQNTTVIKGTGQEEVKILCKISAKCFYSEYTNNVVDHFRFYTNSKKDLIKMENLVNDFIKAL